MSRKRVLGRPPKYNDEQLAEIAQDFEEYIETHDDPTVVGFSSSYRKYVLNKTYMTDRPEFSKLITRAIEKQEQYLLSGATKNKLNAAVSIFRLKQPQHGFKDRSEVDTSFSGKVNFVNVVPRANRGDSDETDD